LPKTHTRLTIGLP